MNIKTIFPRAFLLLGVALTGFSGGAWSADYESHWLEVRVLDKYSGKPIPAAKKSISFRIIYRSPHKTLEDEEINSLNKTITDRLVKEYNATLPA